MNSFFRFLLMSSLLATLLNFSTAQADIIIDVPDATVFADGVGFVDVLISADAGEDLVELGYEFAITPLAGATTSLTVTGIEGGVLGNISANYVFAAGTNNFGQEVDVTTPINPLVTTTFIAGDALDFVDPGVTPTNALLTRINFQHSAGIGGAAAAVGHQFSLALLDDGNTFFDGDVAGMDLTFNTDSGTITVAATPVPEPSPMGMGLLVVLGGVFAWKRRQSLPTAHDE